MEHSLCHSKETSGFGARISLLACVSDAVSGSILKRVINTRNKCHKTLCSEEKADWIILMVECSKRAHRIFGPPPVLKIEAVMPTCAR